MSLVTLERVRYRYEGASLYALDNISLEIKSGEYVLLAGASGSGKSTLCRLLNGLVPHFHGGVLEGRVCVDGLDTREHTVSELFAHVGLVFQDPEAMLFNSTVEREIAFGLESLGVPRDEMRERIRWALQVTGLSNLRLRPPHALSGGEQQRVALAAILALRPRVLALDEPFANLDPATAEHLRTLLRTIHSEGTTIVVAEHRLQTPLQDATRLVILDHGKLVCDGSPSQVLKEDLTGLPLDLPFIVQLARAAHWNVLPLSVGEALAASPSSLPPSLLDRRNGARPPADAPRLVEIKDVSYVRDGHPILENVQFDLRRGESLALIGKNGSGKTTLLKHINGLLHPSSGAVTVLGQDTRRARVSDLARMVALVFQNPNDQLFKPNVREEIEVAPRILGRFDADWLNRLIDDFALRPLLDRSPFSLSEGEKKRVAFASALAAKPQILVLDEPTTGQDSSFRAALVRFVHDLQSRGFAIILATHDLEFAEQVAGRWIALAEGRIIADGSPEQVMQDDVVMARASLLPTARFLLRQVYPARIHDR